jgi:hypothetical protein
MDEKVRHITCHELVHAFTAHLKLPMWLNEGLAMVTVDKLHGEPTVQLETIETLDRPPHDAGPGRYRKLTLRDPDAVVYHYVRGYWITRYLDETQPELLRSLLAGRCSHAELEGKVAAALGLSHGELWDRVDRRVASHFKRDMASG